MTISLVTISDTNGHSVVDVNKYENCEVAFTFSDGRGYEINIEKDMSRQDVAEILFRLAGDML